MNTTASGRIVAAHGRNYVVETSDGSRAECFPRSKRSEIACGDEVVFETTAIGQGVIVEVRPRSSLLYRSDMYRQKLIAANVTQIVVVVATDPPFSDEVLMRCLIAGDEQQLATLIVLNKYDLESRRAAADTRLSILEAGGRRVLRLSARDDPTPLRKHLLGHRNLLVGQSGMGKSTLVNGLVPSARCATGEVSRALNSGRHTTTHASLFRLAPDATLIDSPGLQEFGLSHVRRTVVEQAFMEFRPFLGECRFRDCRHESEPDCALRAAVARGEATPGRLQLMLSILRSLTGTK